MTLNELFQHSVDGVAKFARLLMTGTRWKLPAKNFAKETLQGTVIPTGQGEETTSRNFVSKADRGQFASIVATQDRGAGAMAVLPSRRLVLRRKLLYAVVFAALASVLGETPIATWLHSFDATFMFDELWL